MTRWIAIVAAVVISSWLLPNALAQKQSVYSQQQSLAPQAVKRETAEIVPGQSLDDVAAILRQHGKEFGGPWFEFARVGGPSAEPIDHIGVTLDAEHTAAAIFYEVRNKRVTSIQINLKLSKGSYKSEQFWLSARKITLLPDDSYSIHCEKPTPAPPKPPAERPTRKIPTVDRFRVEPFFGGNGRVPANPIRGDGRY